MSDKWHQQQDADSLVDDLFAEARAGRPGPDAALMDRVMTDAERELAWRRRPVAMPQRRGWLAVLGGFFGGGQALAGLVSAAVAGMAIGWASPGSVQAMMPALMGDDTIAMLELIPDFGLLLDDETDG